MLKKIRNITINEWFWVGLFTLVGLVLRLIGLDYKSLHGDEIIAYWRATQSSVGAIVRLTLFEHSVGHPPLGYIINHLFFDVLGISTFAFRLPGVIAGTLSIPFVYLLTRKYFDTKTAIIAALLTACHPYYILIAQEARNYGLMHLFGLASLYYFLNLYTNKTGHNKKRDLAGYLLSTLAIIWTHPFAWVLLATQMIWVVGNFLIRRAPIREYLFWFIIWGTVITASIPCLYIMIKKAIQIKTIINPNPVSLIMHFKSLTGLFLHWGGGFLYASYNIREITALLSQPLQVAGIAISIIIPLIIIVWGCRTALVDRKKTIGLLFMQLLIALLLAGFVFHVAIDARHFSLFVGMFTILLAAGIARSIATWWGKLILLPWIIVLICAHAYYYPLSYNALIMDDTNALYAIVNAQATSKDLIVLDSFLSAGVFMEPELLYHGSARVLPIQVFWRRFFVDYPELDLRNAEVIWLSTSKQSITHPHGSAALAEFAVATGHPHYEIMDFGKPRQWRRLVKLTRLETED